MKKTISVVLVLFCSGALFAQETLGPFRSISSVTNAVAAQQDEQDVDWKSEFERLEYRLRELEDDLVTQGEGLTKDRAGQGKIAKSTSSELEELSKTVESLSESVGDIEDAVPLFATHSGRDHKKLEVFGRIHYAYFAFSDIDTGVQPLFGGNPADSFGFRRIRIGIKGEVNENMFYKIQTEFAGANNFQFRDVLFGFKDLPFLQKVTIGNHKRPYNLDQLNSSNDNIFLDRPFIGDAFNDNARRLGVSTEGHTDDLKYNWRSGVYNLQNVQSIGSFSGDNYQLEVASRYAATPWYDECSGGRGYLHLAVSSAHRFPDGLGPNNLSEFSTIAESLSGNILATGPIFGAESESLLGLETVLNIGPFQAGAEYAEAFVDRFEPVGSNLNFHGGYLYASYILTGEHHPWNRKNGTLGRLKPFENFFAVRDCNCDVKRGKGAWEIAARYSYIDLNDEDIAAGSAESLTIGLNWYWNQNARMQFNYINGDAEQAGVADGTYDIFGLQFEIFF